MNRRVRINKRSVSKKHLWGIMIPKYGEKSPLPVIWICYTCTSYNWSIKTKSKGHYLEKSIQKASSKTSQAVFFSKKKLPGFLHFTHLSDPLCQWETKKPIENPRNCEAAMPTFNMFLQVAKATKVNHQGRVDEQIYAHNNKWGVEPNIGVVFTPQIIHLFIGFSPYFHHPFWGTTIFGNT